MVFSSFLPFSGKTETAGDSFFPNREGKEESSVIFVLSTGCWKEDRAENV